MNINFGISGLDKLNSKIGKLAAEGDALATILVKKAAIAVHKKAIELVPVDTGNLKQKIKIEFGELTASVYTESGYAAYVEFGTGPHFPPSEPLEVWASRHGMDEGAGFAIAKAISERGLPAQPFLGPAVEEAGGAVSGVSISSWDSIPSMSVGGGGDEGGGGD
jgi:HK97 gp10 family phage protein